jgi:tetratricopeptide (TPR) repeat protein
MQIGTSYTSGLFGTGSTGTAGTGSNFSGLSGTSTFGAATNVSIGGYPVTGFSDLTASTGWQYDLSAVLGTQQSASGVPQQYRSEEQQELEASAIENALEALNAGDHDFARAAANAVLKENPTNAAAVHVLGSVALAEQDYEAAEQLFRKAHAISPTVGYDNDANNARLLQEDDSEVLRQALTMTRTPLRREEGIRVLMSLTDRSPDNNEARIALGDALLESGDGNNGLMQYSTAIRDADSAQLNQLEDRLAELHDEAPESTFVMHLLGKIELKRGNYDEAIQIIQRAADQAEDATPYYYDLAKAYVGVAHERMDRGDLAGGMQSLAKAKELSPDRSDVKAALAEGHVLKAEQLAQLGDLDGALQEYSTAAGLLEVTAGTKDLRERAASSVYSLGRKLERERVDSGGEIDGEVLAYQTAYDLNSDNATYKRKLADTRVALGDQETAAGNLEQAAYAYRRAHELYENDPDYKEMTRQAFIAWGDERMASMNFGDAIDAYMEAFDLDQTDQAVKANLGEAYYQRGLDHLYWERDKDAMEDFKNALTLFPDNALRIPAATEEPTAASLANDHRLAALFARDVGRSASAATAPA